MALFGVSEWLLFAKWANFLLYHNENKSHSMRWWLCLFCTSTHLLLDPTCLVGFLQCHSLKQQSRVDMSLHQDTLSWFCANLSALSPLCSMFSGEARNTNFIVFGLTRLGLEPLIYHTRCEHHWVGWICWIISLESHYTLNINEYLNCIVGHC